MATLFRKILFAAWLVPIITGISFGQEKAWISEVNSVTDYMQISVPDDSREDLVRTSKFLAPANDSPGLLQTVYQNVNKYLLHIEFMAKEFPDRFGGITAAEYMNLVLDPATRTYFAGALFQFKDKQNNSIYGFDIYSSPGKTVKPEEIKPLFLRLSETMKLRPLAYSPLSPQMIETARRWVNPGFPVYLPSGLVEPDYEIYSAQSNYGRVRLFTLDKLTAAVENGLIGWQDIVVVDTAPTDIDTVVAGIVTGSRQGELSHVNVRSVRRGTPNLYVRNPLEVFKPYEGQLVKLVLTADSYSIQSPVAPEEAEAWWNAHRPKLPSLPVPDDDYYTLRSLPEMGALDFPAGLILRFGGKASQLGILYSAFYNAPNGKDDLRYLVDGFAIPYHYYKQFMQSNSYPDPQKPDEFRSYENYLAGLMQDKTFKTDPVYRRKCLEDFQEYAKDNAVIDQQLINKIIEKTAKVYGTLPVTVRFRSSSNTEDDLMFNGAGLYDSTSVIVENIPDNSGRESPAKATTKKAEKTIERGLKKVWLSLWNPKAFDERSYYQIDHLSARMGILVSRAYPSEDSNGVAFTGDLATGSKNYFVVNVQKGDTSVVLPDPGVSPEKDLIYVDTNAAPRIQRAHKSSLVPDGYVLNDDQLKELALLLIKIESCFPLDTKGYNRDRIIFDTEFKFDQGKLVIKQIRPALLPGETPPPVQQKKVVLTVPPNTQMAAMYGYAQPLAEVYWQLSLIDFIPGDYELPLNPGKYDLHLISKLQFGPKRLVGESIIPGQLTVEKTDSRDGNAALRYQYEETFRIKDGTPAEIHLVMQGIEVPVNNDASVRIIMDHHTMIHQLSVTGTMTGTETIIEYSALTDEAAQIFRHRLVLADNQRIDLYEMITRRIMGMGIAFAKQECADINIQNKNTRIDSYWNLAYTALGHCWDAKFRVVFDTPAGDIYGIDVITKTLNWGANTEAEAYYLDKDLNYLRKIDILNFSREEVSEIPDITKVEEWRLY